MSDDFYVGYQPTAPTGLARFVRRVILLLLVVCIVLAALLTTLQKPFDPGTFEFGVVRSFEGVVQERPHPTLWITRPGRIPGQAVATSHALLVAPGKWGAGALVEGLAGEAVTLEGSLVYRDGQTMIEVQPGSIQRGSDRPEGTAASAATVDLGTHTLTGEIVDAKCYLGVMKPGRQKPHRACATRCISGGIPPLLVSETETGDRGYFLLVDEGGGPLNDRILDLVAEPVEITGQLRRQGDLLMLYAEPAAIVPLAD